VGKQQISTGQASPATPPNQTLDGALWKEWAECRATIGRFDTILVDLRKVGFSLITTLLTASAFFGFVAPPLDARAAAILAIMVLIAVLSAVDNYYEVLLSGAVERALDLEVRASPPICLTKYLARNTHNTKAVMVTWLLYCILLIAATGLGLLAGISAGSIPAVIAVAAVGVVLALLMILNWSYADQQAHVRHWKEREWPVECR
jgi:hypothetical protein